MPNGNDVYNLADGWLELDSDPGLFSLLLQDIGVEGVQVEEIYDLQADPLVDPIVLSDGTKSSGALGFIFLFKWVEERRARLRKIADEEPLYHKDDNDLFFAHQIVPNSCATHALVSIMLNVDEDKPNCPRFKLGHTLKNFKNNVESMDAETKGLAIGNSPQLAQAHNSHAVPRARRRQERPVAGTPSLPSSSRNNLETFHFVSYVPVNGHLYELDGLKRYPIDHGLIPEGTDWTETFRTIIKERLGMATSGAEPYHDIRFALMAVVPDRRSAILDRLMMLRSNRNIVAQALRHLVEKHSDSIRSSTRLSSRNPGNLDEDEELANLEKDVNKILQKRKRTGSRPSSIDSNPPGSPFQSNPLLVTHDYSKSPMMETVDDEDGAPVPEVPAEAPNVKDFDPKVKKLEPQMFSPPDLLTLLRNIESDIADCDNQLKDENEKMKRHQVDDCRRVHDYDEFITTFLAMLAEQGHLGDLLEHSLNIKTTGSTSNSSTGSSVKSKSSKPGSLSKKQQLLQKNSRGRGKRSRR